MLKHKSVTIGKRIHINGRLFIHGKKNGIKIGDNVTIQSSVVVNPTSGFNHTHLRAEGNGYITIGNSVGISHANIVSFSSIKIEENVLIGSGVKIWDTDFHSLAFQNRCQDSDNHVSALPIWIKRGAFIGACSIILKGVTIGECSIVGAGSVVTRDVPDNEIWAGNPAKFVKKCEE